MPASLADAADNAWRFGPFGPPPPDLDAYAVAFLRASRP
jgi:hypothetical protein